MAALAVVKLFLRLSLQPAIKPSVQVIGWEWARDRDANGYWPLAPGRNAVTQRPSSHVTSYSYTESQTKLTEYRDNLEVFRENIVMEIFI